MTNCKLQAFLNPFAFFPFKSSFLSCKFASFLGKTLAKKYKKRECYTSVSHKVCGKYIFVAVAFSQEPAGADIEILAPKSPALLKLFTKEEYEVLGVDINSQQTPQAQKWLAFYTLWCAKEALIKKLRLTQDKRPRMAPVSYRANLVADKFAHFGALTLQFNNQNFQIKTQTATLKNTGLILALTD